MSDPLTAGIIAGTDSVGVARTLTGRVVAAGVWVANRHNWIRIVEVILGAGLFIAGMLRVAAPVIEPAVENAAKVAAVAAV